MPYRPRADDEDLYPTLLGIGQAHHVADPPDDRPELFAHLYVPDPESRSGWREYGVRRHVGTALASPRPVGFRSQQ